MIRYQLPVFLRWLAGRGKSWDAATVQDFGKGSASVHLSFDHLEPVDVASDDAGVPGHGEAVEDGLLVAFDAVGEGVQVGLVVGADGGEPVVEAVAVQAGEDLANSMT